MADLSQIQKRLNDDSKFRGEFLANPANTLKTSGVTLDKKQEDALVHLVKRLKESRESVAGSSVDVARAEGVDISINISKNF
jgi:hypothetical protein